MNALSPAAMALVDALKDPALAPDQRLALVAALQAVTASPPPAAVPAPARRPRRAAPPATASATAPAAEPEAEPARLRADRLLLTKTAINTMPLPAAGERLVYDTQAPQLAVRLRPTGRSFIVVTWDRKRRCKVSHTLGNCKSVTPEQARAQAQRLVGLVADGEDIRRARAEGMTLGQLVKAWYAEKSKVNRTADEMQRKALDYLGRLEHKPLAEVTREDIGQVHHRIATQARRRVLKRTGDEKQTVEIGEPGIPATADKWLAIMSSVYGWAGGKGLVSSNPCKGIKKVFNTKTAARQTYLHGEALLRFWEALQADADADVRDLLLLALYTGQRKGNVTSMRWDDVDLDAGLWTISGARTKQKKEQTNPLSAQAREILARRFADAGTPWVFPAVRVRLRDGRELGHMADSRPRDAWARICKAAGIEGVRIHDLRHTAGSWLARLGANEAVRQKALGHQTPAMAARYSHLELDPVADAMQRMGDAITLAATEKKAAAGNGKKAAP